MISSDKLLKNMSYVLTLVSFLILMDKEMDEKSLCTSTEACNFRLKHEEELSFLLFSLQVFFLAKFQELIFKKALKC